MTTISKDGQEISDSGVWRHPRPLAFQAVTLAFAFLLPWLTPLSLGSEKRKEFC